MSSGTKLWRLQSPRHLLQLGAVAIPLEDLLRTRYSPPAWGFLREVPNGTGWSKDRTADAIAMSLWPSRGLDLHGFEMKKSRGDWLKELKKPQKAEAFVGFCDYWWIVAEKDVVKLDEVPSTWGLLVRAGKTLRAKKEAPRLEAAPPDRGFLASIFRQISTLKDDYVLKSEIQATVDAALSDGISRGKEIAEHGVERRMKEMERREQEIKAFEKASGVEIPTWHGGEKLGQAVKVVMDGDMNKHMRHLERMVHGLGDVQDDLKVALEEWRELPQEADELRLIKAAFLRLSDCIEMMGVPDENRFEFGIRQKAWRMLTANGVDDSFSNFHEAREFLRTWEDSKDERK